MISKSRLDAPVAPTGGANVPNPAVPWWTVISLAVLLAFADGFWMVSLRGAVGAIERTQAPFATWLQESTAALPLFILAVLAALTLALRRFGPALPGPRAVVATGLLVAGAATLVGIAEIAASAAWDYFLQLQLMHSMDHSRSASLDPILGQASLGLQLVGLGYGSAIVLVTNIVAVGWALAIRGGRLKVSQARRRTDRGSSIGGRRIFLAVALFGSAAIHAAVVPEHLSEWVAAAAFFGVLAAIQLAAGVGLLLGVPHRLTLLAVAAASVLPLTLWLYSRTVGLPFGRAAGIPESFGLPDCAAGALELGILLVAVEMLRTPGRTCSRPPASAHIRSLAVMAAISIGVLGLAGSGLGWLDNADSFRIETVTIHGH